MRYLLIPPGDTRPSLVVETVAKVDERSIATFRDDLFGMGCANGLLFDADTCVVLRDTFTRTDAATIEEDARLATDQVLSRTTIRRAGSLEFRVERWLQVLSTDWNKALPDDPDVASPFIMDIVPAAMGSDLRAVKSVIPT